MYEFYCPVCNRKCENDEIDIREGGLYGEDWDEYHITCDSDVDKSFKDSIK